MKIKVKTLKIMICMAFMFCMMPQMLNAQKKGPMNLPTYDNELYHYGFILGYNQMLFSIDYIDNYQNIIHSFNELPNQTSLPTTVNSSSDFRVKDISPQMTHGFTVGIVGNLRLGRYFDLRLIPSLSFGTRKINYYIESITRDIHNPNIIVDERIAPLVSETHSTFVEFPLHVKYRSKRFHNSAAYLIGGVNYKIDMASQKKNYDENNKPKNINIKRHDLAAEIGAGFDFYTGYFKLGVEIKMSYGLLDVAKEEAYVYTTSFDHLRNKCFQLSFTFE